MIDIHNHLLHGLDDGSPDLKTSVEMSRMAAADGITHMIATPHASHRYTFSPELVADRLRELRAALAKENVPLTLATGCDFHLSYDNIQDAIQKPRRYTLNSTQYLLVELPDIGLAQTVGETLYELRLADMVPILTHPERNPTLQRDPARMEAWMRDGLLLQITAGSVLGHMGKSAQKMSLSLLNKRWVHFISTDAHNTGHRPPRMRETYDVIAKAHGESYAKLICVDNPAAVFAGEALPQQEEPTGLYHYSETKAFPWWKKLFG
jgi:protein-tyrosine phosphatase